MEKKFHFDFIPDFSNLFIFISNICQSRLYFFCSCDYLTDFNYPWCLKKNWCSEKWFWYTVLLFTTQKNCFYYFIKITQQHLNASPVNSTVRYVHFETRKTTHHRRTLLSSQIPTRILQCFHFLCPGRQLEDIIVLEI